MKASPAAPDAATSRFHYVPSEKQLLFHQAPAMYVLFGGARGPGKTRANLQHIKLLMLTWPGIPILLGRRDLSDLKRTSEKEWTEKVCEPQLYDGSLVTLQHKGPDGKMYTIEGRGQHHKAENWYRFANGSQLYLAELKDIESWRSATLGYIGIEEVKEVEEDDVRDLTGALRWTSGIGTCERVECHDAAREMGIPYRPHSLHPRYQIGMTTNPAAGWLKDRFWTPWKQGRERPNHRFIPATVFDNPHLPPGYIKSLLEDNPPQWVQNYVYGDWSAFENMAYPQFLRALHLFRGPTPFGKFKRVIGGIDYGSTGVEAHRSALYLTAELEGGRYLTFWEHRIKGAPSRELFALIKEKTVQYRVDKWYADASQFIANGNLRDAGVPVDDAARYQGAVKDGINLGDMLMTPGATGEPQWHYTEDCVWLPAALESYQKNPETGDAIKKNDDECDAWRYSIMGVTEGRIVVAQNTQWRTKTDGVVADRRGRSSILQRRKADRAARLKKAIGA